MEQLKQAAKILNINVDDIVFTEEFVQKIITDADGVCRTLFAIAVDKPEEAPTDKWVYIRAQLGCFLARMLYNAHLNPLEFAEDHLSETLKSVLTLYELNNKTSMLSHALVQNLVLPTCVDGKVSEAKIKELLQKEFLGLKAKLPALANVDFDTQFASESGQRSYKNALNYFKLISGIYYKSN